MLRPPSGSTSTATPKPLPSPVRAKSASWPLPSTELQQRVKKLIDDRTLTLAAISHDLKTPLTRAQLRVEDIDNAELRQQIDGDLAEMLTMVDFTLAFLKGDQTGEPVRTST